MQGETYHHSKPLPDAVVQVLKPIYEHLTKDSILEGCLGGFTQNNCKSLNHLIWARCPKTFFSGRNHLDAAAVAAVIVFNEGRKSLCGVFPTLGIPMGKNTQKLFTKADVRRVRDSRKSAVEVAKRIRRGRRNRRKAAEASAVQKEGVILEDFRDFIPL